ncbi:sensor histidine kinase [Fodinibius halophilus]|uniref:Histidine kinase domain-containing protein n=1 Tax=Fodinibius halophilus TaxID=1736908 RepID=A0A6M1T874_9BACT|nr:histidine kinase [Fodinibius halophilus]NGP89655.1 hypothetical protein [Fodinibius halophilus]
MNQQIDTLEIEFSKPRITWRGIGLVFFISLLYVLLYTGALSYAENVPFLSAFIGSVLSTVIKVILLFGNWYFIVRECYKLSGWKKLILHILAGIAFAIAWYYSYLILFDLFFGIEYLEGGGFIENWIWVVTSAYFEYGIAFSIIHVIDSIKKLRERERQAAKLQELSNQQQIANLKAQLNPHFLFNTLNSINAMVSRDVDKTRDMIARLSDMLRYSLQSFENEKVALSEEIGFIEKYLQLEKPRLGDRLSYDINVDRELHGVEIPPMIIQPIVENAVKHGISPSPEGGKVEVNITHQNEHMVVEVNDTGCGISDSVIKGNSNGIGIRNTEEHLQKRYGEESGLAFSSNEKGGTNVRFKIPIGG